MFFFNDTATTEIYTLSLHDALPICLGVDHEHGVAGADLGLRVAAELTGEAGADGLPVGGRVGGVQRHLAHARGGRVAVDRDRSEEHTSELQSRQYLVCRLLLENKKT